jgi:hypothetical protein
LSAQPMITVLNVLLVTNLTKIIIERRSNKRFKVSNGPAYLLSELLLLCIMNLKMDSEVVISFFNEGKSISPDLPFLQFCKKWDICTLN